MRILWVQEKNIQDRMSFEKVKGEENTADGLTKYIGTEILEKMMRTMRLRG